MDTLVEALEDNKVKVTVTVDADDIDARIKRTYRDYARKYNFPGFRKGKAPRPVIDNALGSAAVPAAVTDDVVNDYYPRAIEAERIFPVGQPDFGDPDLIESGKPYTFTFAVSVKPQIELSSYDPVEIEMPAAAVSDAEVEEQINVLLEHYTTYEDASAQTKIKAENYADLAIKATDEAGEAIASIQTESRLYGPGTGMLSGDFDEQILGMKKGQTKEFELEVAQDEESVLLASQAGKKISFEVTCNVVKKKVVPELTDEWASDKMGFENAQDFREGVVDSLQAQKDGVLPRIKENSCVAQLLERFEGEVDEAMAEEAESDLLQEFFTQLQQQGMSFDSYLSQEGISSDQFKADVKLQANDEAKRQLALDAWARAKGIEATDEEVSAEFAKADLDDPAATEQQWRDSGRLYLIREGIVRAKAMDDVLESAVVTEVDYAAKAQAEREAAKKPAKKASKKKEAAQVVDAKQEADAAAAPEVAEQA